ncbi:MAG: type pantothenate kinase [Bacillota bacterium]|jgi:type III pantothenate kinase|nr:type pantothenate kinase [Bacillota bacterium]
MGLLLALDVGNTHVTAGVFRGSDLIARWRLQTNRTRTEDEYGVFLRHLFAIAGLAPEEVEGVAVASVVPPLNWIWEKLSRRYFGCEPLMVQPETTDTGIQIRLDNPREVGADRIVNAVAAHTLYGGPCIVVDFGTATTFDVISAAGEYLGGAIAPGILTATEALFQKAAKLPRIELIDPGTAVGKNTVTSMQAGIVYGFAGQVDALVRRIRRELGEEAKAIATGGLATMVADQAETIDVVDLDLTLTGLRLIYERLYHRP